MKSLFFQPFLAGSLVFAAVVPGFAAPEVETNVLTLERAVLVAVSNNPELRGAGSRVDAARGRAAQAVVWSNPELELSSEDWAVNRDSFSDSKQLIGVSQTVPFPGKKRWERKIGEADVRGSELEVALRRAELIREVKTAFYRELSAERRAEVTRDLIATAQNASDAARKRAEAGEIPLQEQLRAEVELEKVASELVVAQREATTSRQDLATLLGWPDLGKTSIAGALSQNPNLKLLEAPEQWVDRHPRVIAARVASQRAQFEARRARLEPYPDVKFGVQGGREGALDSSIVQFRITLPLPIIDRSKGRKQEARANVAGAEADLASIQQRLMRDWTAARDRFYSANQRATSYRDRILPKAKEALRLAQIGFEKGKFSYIDLADAQRSEEEAQLDYQKILLELNLAQADLECLLVGSGEDFKSQI